MGKIKRITLIGSGNVAHHLGLALYESGVKIDCVYSRTIEHAKTLADKFESIAINNIVDIIDHSDLYLFAVSDNAIEPLAKQLSEQLGYTKLVAHTSGMVSSNIFKMFFNNYGVFYALQTFTKGRDLDIKKVPFMITSNDPTFENQLFNLAESISNSVSFVDDNKRKVLHIAAVFANNFTNYMYSVSKNILQKENLNLNLLYPLIEETSKKIIEGENPAKIQTGPAIRNDIKTINSHLDYLKYNHDYKKLYKLMTKLIQNE
jgi:predicted short-subunit dehydrogenase-like oxidoreductase (DUF2520 family)